MCDAGSSSGAVSVLRPVAGTVWDMEKHTRLSKV